MPAPKILDIDKLAEAAKISPQIIRKNIHHIEKTMGFKHGDILKLAEIFKDKSHLAKPPCIYCGKRTGRKEGYCLACEAEYDLTKT